jgi:hypothetical protein
MSQNKLDRSLVLQRIIAEGEDPWDVKGFVSDPKVRAQLEADLDAAVKVCHALDEARKITPETLMKQITI